MRRVSINLLTNVILLLAGIILIVFHGTPNVLLWCCRVMGAMFLLPAIAYLVRRYGATAGVVISGVPITDVVPLQMNDDVITTQFAAPTRPGIDRDPPVSFFITEPSNPPLKWNVSGLSALYEKSVGPFPVCLWHWRQLRSNTGFTRRA